MVVRAPDSPAAQALIEITEKVALQVAKQNLATPRKHRPILAPELKFVG